jgi:hypothetical protein
MDHCWCHGHPLSKKKKTMYGNVDGPHSPNLDPTVLADNLQETDSDSEMTLARPSGTLAHAGTKLSLLDGEALDGDWDTGEEEAEGEAINLCMVQMLSDLQDNDLCNQEWKPMHRQKKRNIKTG